MSLIKRGKFYWLDIRIKGKRYRRSLKTTKKNEALRKYGKVRDDLVEQYAGEKLRLESFCKQYLEWAYSSKPISALREEQRLRKIQDFFKGLDIVHLDDITPYHVEQLKAELKRKNLKKSTINCYLHLLKGLFNRAIDWEVYEKPNPLKKVRFLRYETTVQALSHEEEARVLEVAKNISDAPYSPVQKVFYDMVILALNTGMRKSEILNLRWRNVKENAVRIKGKGDKIRSVPLNSKSMDAIQKQIRRGEFVFDVPNRRQDNVIWRTVKRIRNVTGIDFHFHILRHTFATRLIEKGVDIITVSALLGHSKLTTSLLYSHTDEEKMKKAVDLLGE